MCTLWKTGEKVKTTPDFIIGCSAKETEWLCVTTINLNTKCPYIKCNFSILSV